MPVKLRLYIPFGTLVVVNEMFPFAPPQIVGLVGVPSVSVGLGLTVMVKVTSDPVCDPNTGVTVIVATCWEVTLAAVKLPMLPVPLAARPIAVLLLVQLKVAPEVPVKLIAGTVSVPQAWTLLTGSTSGTGSPTKQSSNVIREPAPAPLCVMVYSVAPTVLLIVTMVPVAELLFMLLLWKQDN